MAKRHNKDLKNAVQALLDRKYLTDDNTQLTGAELIALTLFDQARDPSSPYYGKALDTIVKLTFTSEKERLQANKLQIEVTTATAPQMWEEDPFSESIKQYIRDDMTAEFAV